MEKVGYVMEIARTMPYIRIVSTYQLLLPMYRSQSASVESDILSLEDYTLGRDIWKLL